MTTKSKGKAAKAAPVKLESAEALGASVAQAEGKLRARCDPHHAAWLTMNEEDKKTMRVEFIRGHMRFDPLSMSATCVEIPLATVEAIMGMGRGERSVAQHKIYERGRLAFRYNVERPEAKDGEEAKSKTKLQKLRDYCTRIAKLEFAEEKAISELKAAFAKQSEI